MLGTSDSLLDTEASMLGTSDSLLDIEDSTLGTSDSLLDTADSLLSTADSSLDTGATLLNTADSLLDTADSLLDTADNLLNINDLSVDDKITGHAVISLHADDYQIDDYGDDGYHNSDDYYDNYIYQEDVQKELGNKADNINNIDAVSIDDLDVIDLTKPIEVPDKKDLQMCTEDVDINKDVFKYMSVEDLKLAAKKIISGEKVDNSSLNVKGEVGELLRLISELKEKMDDITPTVSETRGSVPDILTSLVSVNRTTDDAITTLVQSAETLLDYYKLLSVHTLELRTALKNNDIGAINNRLEAIDSVTSKIDKMGLRVLESLEFQDITEQKLHKVMLSMREIGTALGSLVGFLHFNSLPIKDDSDDVKTLLNDFGLN